MMDQITVLITGTNKGIGENLVKIFLKYNPKCLIIATTRQPPEVAYQRWHELDADQRVRCKQLDMKSKESIHHFVEQIQKEGVKIDILVNNAGVCRADELQKDIPSLEWVQECLEVNLIAQIDLTEQLLPFMSNLCKIVNVCSTVGALKNQPSQTQQKYSQSSNTKSDILQAVDQYIQETKKQKLVSFSPNVYATSKMLLAAWSRFVLRKQLKKSQICICVAPGLCLTQMTQGMSQQIKEKAHTSQSGAIKIHETIFLSQLDADVFYHRARKSDFYLCGEGLPRN